MRFLTVGLGEILHSSRHNMCRAFDGDDAISILGHSEGYDACIAEAGNVTELFPFRLRKREIHTPLIMLTTSNEPKVRAEMLNRGADQCLTLPIDEVELEAHAQAVVRRCCGDHSSNKIGVGDLVVDLDRNIVQVNGVPVRLTNKEYSLFEVLVVSPNRIFTKEGIIRRIYDDLEDPPLNKIVDVFVCKIRKKLAPVLGYDPIRTIWGRGYQLNTEELCHA